jgi:hypothetical protein
MPNAQRIAKIEFLISTGADTACLMPGDVFRLRLEETDWGTETELRGLDGTTIVYQNNATITFVDRGNGLVNYKIPVYVYPNKPPYDKQPSVLGRNMLENWRLHYSQSEKKLSAEVLRHDLLIPLPISPHRPL